MENSEKIELYSFGNRNDFKIYESIKKVQCSKYEPIMINGVPTPIPDGFQHIISIYNGDNYFGQMSFFVPKEQRENEDEIKSLRAEYARALVKHYIKNMSEFIKTLEPNEIVQA